MKVVLTSIQTIKPSCPTPHHLRHLPLSFLDQINFNIYDPVIYFYPSGLEGGGGDITATTVERCDRLKKSLSETLTRYYPLAGRIKQDLFIECSDEGVLYLEAEVKCQLSQVVAQPNHDEFRKLFPCDVQADAGDMLLSVQVNIFDCGGMAIGMCFNHKFCDALSIATFVNNWAASSRGDHSKIVYPKFDLAMHFPPRDHVQGYTASTVTTKEKIVAKSFVFSNSAISALRTKYARGSTQRMTRFETLTVFIWKRFVAASTAGPGRSYRVVLPVNLRPKMNPPLPEYYFGNVSLFAMAVPSMDKSTEEDCGLVAEMRKALGKIDENYVKKLQEGNPNPGGYTGGGAGAVSFTITSVYRFPIYDADFGWGRPIYMTQSQQTSKSVVVLLPTRSEDGIEALIYLQEDEMAKLEADKEFLAFVSPTSAAKPLSSL